MTQLARTSRTYPGDAAAAPAENDHTSQKLLDAAEAVFAHKGYDAASVREITSAAGANIAAVNYHFGSKEALYAAVFGRILDHLREQRIAAITQVAEQAAAKHDLELLLRAFCTAFLAPLMDPARGQRMLQLFMREMTSPQLPQRLVVEKLVEPIQQVMAAAMARTCPGLGEIDAVFCLHSVVGQLIHVLQVWRLQEAGQLPFNGDELIQRALAHIVHFSAAGIRAKVQKGFQA